MVPIIKSEVRKLISVRSTYWMIFVALALITFISFYIEGMWGQSGSPAGSGEALALKEIVGSGAGIAALFIAIIAILQIGHEYRHNTIMYTLTTNSRRTRVLIAKVIVTGVFSVAIGLLATLFSVAAYKVGLSFRDVSLQPQEIDFAVSMWRVAVYTFVYGVFGLILGLLLRNLIGAIVVFLIAPATVEPLLSILLKDNAQYLPFSSFDHIMGNAITQGSMSSNTAMAVSLGYIVFFGIIAWVLFLRRDAN